LRQVIRRLAKPGGKERILCVHGAIAAKRKSSPVNAVGSRLQPHVHCRSRHPAVLRLRTLDGIDLLNGVQGEDGYPVYTASIPADCGPGASGHIDLVNAVQHPAVIAAADAIAVVGGRASAGKRLHAGVEVQQLLKGAAVERQVYDRRGFKRPAQRRAGRVHHWRFAGDGHCLGLLPGLQR